MISIPLECVENQGVEVLSKIVKRVNGDLVFTSSNYKTARSHDEIVNLIEKVDETLQGE